MIIACSNPIANNDYDPDQQLLLVGATTWYGNSTRSRNWHDDTTVYSNNNQTEIHYVYDAINSTFIVGRGTKIAVELSSYDGSGFNVANFTFGEVEVIGN